MEGYCAMHDFSLDEVLNTAVKVDELHKLLFAVTVSIRSTRPCMRRSGGPRVVACKRRDVARNRVQYMQRSHFRCSL